MTEKLNYISDEELEKLICQVEQEELVAAPPDLMEKILAAAGMTETAVAKAEEHITEIKRKPKQIRKKEFYAYCFRVVTSVAAAVALVFLLPQMTDRMDVVKPVPDKAAIVASEAIPTKEEVLEDTGVVERIIRNTGWFNKTGNK